jgi:secondary thiamine-phosphate synthase enzyme
MVTETIKANTKGNADIVNITQDIEEVRSKYKIKDGIIFLNVIGSTAAISTMEYESGLEQDIKDLLQQLIPYRGNWQHNFTWGDDNGHSHLRSFMLKTNFFIPVTDAKLDLGTWQQVVLLDFDTRPRQRKIVVKILTG